MGNKFKELKNYFNEKLSSQGQSLMFTFNSFINGLKAEITKEIRIAVSSQHEKLTSQNSRCLNCVNLILIMNQTMKNRSSIWNTFVFVLKLFRLKITNKWEWKTFLNLPKLIFLFLLQIMLMELVVSVRFELQIKAAKE